MVCLSGRELRNTTQSLLIMFVFSETHPLFEGLKLAPRILTEPHKVLAEQKAQQEVKVLKESNRLFTLYNDSDRGSLKRLSSESLEKAYKKVFNDPLTEPYRKEAQHRDNLEFRGDDLVSGDPDMSRGTQYVFDESPTVDTGTATGFLVMREDGEIGAIEHPPFPFFDEGQSLMEAGNVV